MKTFHQINWQKLVLELLVVFLGVTGGFILNNWREGQRNIQLEQKYIQSFVQNIDSNIVALSENIADDTLLLRTLRQKLQVLEKSDFPEDSLIVFINNIVNVSKLDLKRSTFEDIKSSGNLNLIRDFNIKEKIVSYYDLVDGALYVDGYYNTYFSDFILPFVMNNVSLSENKFFTNDTQNQRKLFNIGAGYHSMRLQRTTVLMEVLAKSEILKTDLEKYLLENF